MLRSDKNQNNIRLSNTSSTYAEPFQENGASYYHLQPQQLRVTSLVDSFEPVYGNFNADEARFVYRFYLLLHTNDFVLSRYKRNLNPLARTNAHADFAGSEEYGTFRKGPYVINDEIGHVCHRRYSDMEEATEL